LTGGKSGDVRVIKTAVTGSGVYRRGADLGREKFYLGRKGVSKGSLGRKKGWEKFSVEVGAERGKKSITRMVKSFLCEKGLVRRMGWVLDDGPKSRIYSVKGYFGFWGEEPAEHQKKFCTSQRGSI